MNIKKWENFKENNPYKIGNFAKRNWGTKLHSLCSYQGKIKPSLAYHLVDVFTKHGDVVSDPFSGSGTIPLEASIAGRIPVANDLSDMAVALSHAKIGPTSFQKCEKILTELEKWISDKKVSERAKLEADEISFNKKISDYFETKTYENILKARDFFTETKSVQDANWCLIFSSMLHILHGNRPYALSRNSHPLTPYAPTGEYIKKDVVRHLRKKSNDALVHKQSLPLNSAYEINQADVLELSNFQNKVADCVITSPPFASSTRFYMTNWMRFWFAGWTLRDFRESEKSFIESKKSEGMKIYKDIFVELRNTIKKGGILVMHVGKNDRVDMGASLLKEKFPSFCLIDYHSESVVNSEKHGIKDKGGTVAHQYLVYERL